MVVGPGRTEHVSRLFFSFCMFVFIFGGGVMSQEQRVDTKGTDGEMDVIWMHDVKYTRNS